MVWEWKYLLEGAAVLVMLGGVVGIFWERIRGDRGIGVRIIQFLTVILLIPTLLILALEGLLEQQTVATLLGAVVGYILSGIGKDEKPERRNK